MSTTTKTYLIAEADVKELLDFYENPIFRGAVEILVIWFSLKVTVRAQLL